MTVRRRTDAGHLAECPMCGSLDIGGATDTVNCYGCGLQITKPKPLQNAVDAWNMRGGKSLDDKIVDDETNDWINIEKDGLPTKSKWYDAFTYDDDGDRIVKTLFYYGLYEDGPCWMRHGDWDSPVTHYKKHYKIQPPKKDIFDMTDEELNDAYENIL